MGHGTDNNDTNNSSTFCPIIQKSGIGLEGNEGWTYPEDKKSAITYNITEVGKMISFTRSTCSSSGRYHAVHAPPAR